MTTPEHRDTQVTFHTIDEALTALKEGQLVIVVDAQDRENEGDFICAAETITPQTVDFMLKIGRGVLCVPLIQETADRLQLAHARKLSSPTCRLFTLTMHCSQLAQFRFSAFPRAACRLGGWWALFS